MFALLPLHAGEAMSDVVVSPLNQAHLFVAVTNVGVMRSLDSGVNWQDFSIPATAWPDRTNAQRVRLAVHSSSSSSTSSSGSYILYIGVANAGALDRGPGVIWTQSPDAASIASVAFVGSDECSCDFHFGVLFCVTPSVVRVLLSRSFVFSALCARNFHDQYATVHTTSIDNKNNNLTINMQFTLHYSQ
jgi:hypothetical protein